MNSIKCPECGFVSFATADKCKRCNLIFKKVAESLESEQINGLPVIKIKPVGLISRLFSKTDKETAYQEIQNLLAKTYIPHISPIVINSILNKYKIPLDEARIHFRDWFLKILKHLAKDLNITDEEDLEIQHLQMLFNFSDEEIKDLQKEVIYPIYESAVRKAFKTSPISPRIKDNCGELAVKLRLNQQIADRIFLKFAQPFYSNIFKEATAHKRVSPKKEAELVELAKNLHISLDEVSKKNLELFKLFWKLSQGDLPVVDMPVSYYQNELCAASISANRFQISQELPEYTIDAHDFKSSEMIINYLRSQLSYSKQNALAGGTMSFLDSGRLYFTNNRILFKGKNKTVYIPLDKIKKYSFFYDGLVFEKKDGSHHIYRVKADNDYLSATLEGLLSNKAYEDYRKKKYSNQQTNKEESKSKSKQYSNQSPPNHLAAYYKTLNLKFGATSEEIKKAYKQQAMKNHPDKFANLAPEYQELAETKMKEINIAFQHLQGQ